MVVDWPRVDWGLATRPGREIMKKPKCEPTVSDLARTLALAMDMDSEAGWGKVMDRATTTIRRLRKHLLESPGAKWTVRASALGFDLHQALGLDDEDSDILAAIERLQARVSELEAERDAANKHAEIAQGSAEESAAKVEELLAAQKPRSMMDEAPEGERFPVWDCSGKRWTFGRWRQAGWQYVDDYENDVIASHWLPCPPDPEVNNV